MSKGCFVNERKTSLKTRLTETRHHNPTTEPTAAIRVFGGNWSLLDLKNGTR